MQEAFGGDLEQVGVRAYAEVVQVYRRSALPGLLEQLDGAPAAEAVPSVASG
jgi:hypothetical protein